MADQIVVLDLRSWDQGGVLAFVTVQVNGVVVRGCQIVQRPGQRPWLRPPQQVVEGSGERKWKDVVEFPEALHDAIETKAVNAWLSAYPDRRLVMVPKFGVDDAPDRQPVDVHDRLHQQCRDKALKRLQMVAGGGR